MRITLIALLLSCPMWAAYSAYRTVTIDHTKVPSTQTNYAVMVCANGQVSGSNCDAAGHSSLNVPNLKSTGNGGLVTSTSGYDIGLFSDACITSLSYDLDTYVASTGFTVLWVNVASLSSSVDNVVYICYGNGAVTTNQSSTATYNSNTKLVWHVPNGTSLTANDSTSGARNGTLVNTPTAVAGQIDGGANFVRASNQYIKYDSSAPVTTFPMTLSGWYRLSNTTFGVFETRAVVSIAKPGVVDDGFWIDLILNNTTPQMRVVTQNAASTFYFKYSAITFDTIWHQFVGVFNSAGSLTMYSDGAAVAGSTLGSSNTPSASTGIFMGLVNPTSGYAPFQGDLDEIRVFDNARSADAVLIDFRNQGQPYDFYTFGAEVRLGTFMHKAISQ